MFLPVEDKAARKASKWLAGLVLQLRGGAAIILADAQIIDHFRPVGRLAGTVAYCVHAAENEVMPYSFSILSVLKLGV